MPTVLTVYIYIYIYRGGGRAKAQGEAAVCCYIPVLRHNPADLQKASTEASTMICRWRNLTKDDKISRETNGESMERQSDETTDRGTQTGRGSRAVINQYCTTILVRKHYREAMGRENEDGNENRGQRIATWGGRQARRRPKNNTL